MNVELFKPIENPYQHIIDTAKKEIPEANIGTLRSLCIYLLKQIDERGLTEVARNYSLTWEKLKEAKLVGALMILSYEGIKRGEIHLKNKDLLKW